MILSLRGKTSNSGIFNDLLQKHISENAGNAKYTSPRIQNKIIFICGKLIKNDIVNLANAANAFSVIADETADISGTEQFSIGIQFLDKHLNLPKILEEFLGFTPLDKLNAQTVATNII